MNVLLVGGESAGIHTLRTLAKSEDRIVAVAALPDTDGATLWSAAEALGVPVWDANRLRVPGVATELSKRGVDLLLNVHSLVVIPPDVLAVPTLGCYNLHPGPLPGYAGLNTVSWAIFRGETEYGVTVHRMDAGIDTGPIAFQTALTISETDTALTLYAKCIREGAALVDRLLAAARNGRDAIPNAPQDLSRRQYFRAGPPDGCRVRWTRPARDIANLVRACDYFPFASPWGHPRARANGDDIHVIKARPTGRRADRPPGTVGDRLNQSVQVACADEWLLVDKVLVDGRSRAASDALGDVTTLDDGREPGAGMAR